MNPLDRQLFFRDFRKALAALPPEKADLVWRKAGEEYRRIRYERTTAVSEGAECCDYRLRYDPDM